MRSLTVAFFLLVAGCAGSSEGTIPVDELPGTSDEALDGYIAEREAFGVDTASACYWTCRFNQGEALYCMCKCHTCIQQKDVNP